MGERAGVETTVRRREGTEGMGQSVSCLTSPSLFCLTTGSQRGGRPGRGGVYVIQKSLTSTSHPSMV